MIALGFIAALILYITGHKKQAKIVLQITLWALIAYLLVMVVLSI